MTLQGSQKLLGVPGFMPELGPGEERRTPLPTSTVSEEAPPSTGVSGASSSRSVARLYSTICQTVGAPTQVRQIGLLAHGPAPAPLAQPGALPSAARPLPSCRALSPGVPPNPPLKDAAPAPPARSPCPTPPVRQPPPSPGWGDLCPGARSPTHVTAAAQLLQRDVHGGVRGRRHLRAPGGWP